MTAPRWACLRADGVPETFAGRSIALTRTIWGPPRRSKPGWRLAKHLEATVVDASNAIFAAEIAPMIDRMW